MSPLAFAVALLLAGDGQEKEILHIPGSGLFGTAVCILGDVNQDGVRDLAVGSPTDICFVAVHSGADGKQIWKAEGQLFEPELGRSLAAVGDVNADGFPDLIAAYPTDPGATDSHFNRAWVLSGRDGAKLLEVLGNQALRDGFASAVAPAGDLDGDAIPDLWIGAPAAPRLGQVTAFSGKDGHSIRHIDSPKGALFGRTMCAMGDIDGDGIGDLAVGGGDDRIAELSLVSGADSKLLRHVRMDSGFLTCLDRIQDINGDGAPEVIVGSHNYPLVMLVSSSSGDVLCRYQGGFDGNPPFCQAAIAVPDLNGDGHQDIAVGGSDREGEGAVYLLSAKSGKILSRISGPRNREFGAALASADLQGDGSVELVVGAPGRDRHAGTVHVFTLNRY